MWTIYHVWKEVRSFRIYVEVFFIWPLSACFFGYRYVPAYSTRLEIKDGMWVVLPPNTSDPMGIIDPVWTESNWNTIGLRVYTVQTGAYDYVVLLGGVAITALAYVAIVIAKASINKMMKLDWEYNFKLCNRFLEAILFNGLKGIIVSYWRLTRVNGFFISKAMLGSAIGF